jgi:hypothetical protein
MTGYNHMELGRVTVASVLNHGSQPGDKE